MYARRGLTHNIFLESMERIRIGNRVSRTMVPVEGKQPYNVSVAAELSTCAILQKPTYLEVTAGRDAKNLKVSLSLSLLYFFSNPCYMAAVFVCYVGQDRSLGLFFYD
uniref:Uncharacterized protein n=1 Tax=Lactuca sativa TaxID=4236 RepID=A0A9R1UCY0_LACSA|nr:hypothetical protein LSAT_V11C900504780 [Lactuca sativa]